MKRNYYALYSPRGIGNPSHADTLAAYPSKRARADAIRGMNELFSPFAGGDVMKEISRDEARTLFPHKFDGHRPVNVGRISA